MRDTTAKIEQYADITDLGIRYRVRAVAGGDIIEAEGATPMIAWMHFDQRLRGWRMGEISRELKK